MGRIVQARYVASWEQLRDVASMIASNHGSKESVGDDELLEALEVHGVERERLPWVGAFGVPSQE